MRYNVSQHAVEGANAMRRKRQKNIKNHKQFCKKCEKPIPLDIDHKDGNSDNNLPINLRLICVNCHRQTPTYGAKNMGKGRDSLKKLKSANMV